jgi:hypothetical protein
MHAPWISAMAQGQAMSVLVRAYSQTHDRAQLDAAVRALGPFASTVDAGGVTDDWDGATWYEEYPVADPQHVLNGFEFTLLGLHDLAPYSTTADDLWRRGVAGLAQRVGRFDDPSGRTQFYAALGGLRVPSPPSYQHEHIVLTLGLARLTGLQVLADYGTRWVGYTRPRPAPVAAAAPPPARPCAAAATRGQSHRAPICALRGWWWRAGRVSSHRARRSARARRTRLAAHGRLEGPARGRTHSGR